MSIDPNVKFLGVTNQNIDLTERRSSKSNGYTDYFSLAEILAEVPAPTVPTLLSELTNDVGFITDNFYTSDDSLTGNRTVTGGGFSLKFTGQSVFNVVSPSASSLDTAFGIRNNTDTSWLSRTLGDGSSETLTGSHAFGITVNTSYRLYAYTSNLTAAFRGYHDGNSGIGVIAQADGNSGIGIQSQALNAGGGTGAVLKGTTNAILFNGGFFDETQSSTPKFPQANAAGEAALLATIATGKWYYLDNADGTATVKVKL